MKLVYQTGEQTRADQIASVLEQAGIATSVQGSITSELRARTFEPYTVWVVSESEVDHASQVLAEFYASESPPSRAAERRPINKALLFFVAAGAAAAVGFLLHGI
jgi:hypothetical protein